MGHDAAPVDPVGSGLLASRWTLTKVNKQAASRWNVIEVVKVDDQAALDHLDHGAVDRLARLGRLLDLAPGLLEAGALLGEHEAPLLVLLGEDKRVHLLAERYLVGRIDRAADRELVGGDDPSDL